MNLKTVLGKLVIVKCLRKLKNNISLKKRNKRLLSDGYSTLSLINDISNKIQIPLWIEWGTLLGYLRDGKLIEHDYDLDFATFELNEKDYNVLYNELLKNNFELVRQFKLSDKIVSETYRRNNVLVDIDFATLENETLNLFEYDVEDDTEIRKNSNCYFYDRMGGYKYSFPLFNIEHGTFSNGTKCIIPTNIEQHIKYLYGENWKLPDKSFYWKNLNNYTYLGNEGFITGWRKD